MSVVVGQRLRPFWGRVSVMDSPVDEEQTASGLIVPLRHEEMKDEVARRGVVLHIDQTYQDLSGWGDYARRLEPGTVVYFREGKKIGDCWIVDIDDILAYEEN